MPRRQHWEGLVVALGEVEQVILDCLSGAGGEASFQDDEERAIEIPQTLTVAEGIPRHPQPHRNYPLTFAGPVGFLDCSYRIQNRLPYNPHKAGAGSLKSL